MMRHVLAPGITIAGRRSNNEDDVWASSWTDDAERSISVLAVADGMGGHTHGEKASQIAVYGVEHAAENRLAQPGAMTEDEIFIQCRKLFDEIDRGLRVYSDKYPDASGMGTTLVLAIVVDDRAHIAHIGDSRAYWVPGEGPVQQLTEDHSASAQAVRDGLISEEDAANSPFQHSLTRCLDGTGDSEPDFMVHHMSAPGFLCLCTDGLSGAVSDARFADVLQQDKDLETATRELLHLAHAQGSQDNITAAVLECGTVTRSTGPSFSGRLNDLLREGGDLPDRRSQGQRSAPPRQTTPITKTRSTSSVWSRLRRAPTWATRALAVLSVLLLGLVGTFVYLQPGAVGLGGNQVVYAGGGGGEGGSNPSGVAASPDRSENADTDPADLSSPQAPDPQAPDPQAPDPQAPDPQAPDPQAPDQQTTDPQAPDQQTTDPQTTDQHSPEPELTARNDSINTSEGQPTAALEVLANDEKPDRDDLTAVTPVVLAGPQHGSVDEQDDGSIVYEPSDGFSGTDTFTYALYDSTAVSDGSVSIDSLEALSKSATVTITVDPANQTPMAENDSVETTKGTATTTDVLANDSDPDGELDPSTLQVQSGPSGGSVDVDGKSGEVTYTPADGFTGTDSYTYTVADSMGVESNEATVTVDVNERPSRERRSKRGWEDRVKNNEWYDSSCKSYPRYRIVFGVSEDEKKIDDLKERLSNHTDEVLEKQDINRQSSVILAHESYIQNLHTSDGNSVDIGEFSQSLKSLRGDMESFLKGKSLSQIEEKWGWDPEGKYPRVICYETSHPEDTR